jgi:hypothetical protein
VSLSPAFCLTVAQFKYQFCGGYDGCRSR